MRLEEAMAKRNYTKQELAGSIGVSRSAPDNWIAGRNAPNFENRKIIERILDCGPIDYPAPSRERRARLAPHLPVVDETGITPDPDPEQLEIEIPKITRREFMYTYSSDDVIILKFDEEDGAIEFDRYCSLISAVLRNLWPVVVDISGKVAVIMKRGARK